MNKTLAITTIALVAVIMGMSVMAPVVLQQAEAHTPGLLKHHCGSLSHGLIFPGAVCIVPDNCATLQSGLESIIHVIDRNGDNVHQHDGTEPEFCISNQSTR